MAFKDSSKEYGDIINLPHPESRKHKRMSMRDRAAQFSPFAALTGHDAAIKETARLTNAFVDLDDTMKTSLDEKLILILEKSDEKLPVTITYFMKDERKSGGSYEVAEGWIRKVDFYERVIVMEDRSRISLDHVVDIDCDIFREY
ncbi:MAG: YolD-like family protein [Lachnoclostridium sp.]|nr:YolD-like family protein [Lachnoclostridium sp.]